MSIIEVNADGKLNVPGNPVIPFIEGDGIGPDIWKATQAVVDAAVKKAYGGKRSIEWKQIYAGELAQEKMGDSLPEETLEEIKKYRVSIKGPLTTPVGGGIRSLNVAIRQKLDLYACVRPVKYIPGVPSPVKSPEKVDMVIFRENTEDVYAGIEWSGGSSDAGKVIDFLNKEMNCHIKASSGIGIKPISPEGTRQLVRKAIQYALENKCPSVTLVHKGNIMKYTEGAFRDWGYQEACENFGEVTITEQDVWEKHDGKVPAEKILIKDRIADAMFQQILLRPSEYSVLALPNLNGDYISDALAAQVGGLGLAPGANIGDGIAVFEATHGTAPKYADQDKVNPGSLILSAKLMMEYMGWTEAAVLIFRGISETIKRKTVTYDLHRQIEGATLLRCSEFAKKIIENM